LGFVARISKTGFWTWAILINATGNSECTDITVDSNENVYIVGWFSGSLYLPPSTNIPAISYSAGYVAKIDKNGNTQWINYTKSTNPESFAMFRAIDIDSSKNLYMTGSYYKNVIVDAATYTDTATIGRVLVVKANPSGVFLWSAVDTGTSALANYPSSFGADIRYDPASGKIFVTGDYRTGDSIFGLFTLTATQIPQYRTFVATLDNTGAWTYSVTVYSGTWFYDRTEVSRMEIVSGNVYITDQYCGKIGLDAALTPAYTVDGGNNLNTGCHSFLFAYDTSLSPVSVMSFNAGGISHQFVRSDSVCKLSATKLALCGAFYGTMTPSSFSSLNGATPYIIAVDISTPSSPSYIDGIVPSPPTLNGDPYQCWCDGSNDVFAAYDIYEASSGTYGGTTVSTVWTDVVVVSASF
jgi:hypothetical protein